MRKKLSVLFLALCAMSCMVNDAHAFTYIFAAESRPDVVTHPIGYTGAGGTLNVTIGIDPTSLHAAAMVTSVQNVIGTWNAQVVTTGNVITDFSIGASAFDFESVLLHEVGHSLGLGHNNMGVQTGVAGSNTEYSNALDGVDNVFTFNPGADGVIGTADDIRGDDVNLNFFNASDNPFVLDATVDRTTYTNTLPLGSTPNQASRAVAASAGFAGIANNTESVLQQGTSNNELQRTLTADDIAGIRYAESGLDEIAGTADDYDLVLNYVTWDGSPGSRPDIVIDFDNSQTGFAVSQSGGVLLGGGHGPHAAITTNSIFFNSGFNWHFNSAAVPEPGAFGMMMLFLGGQTVRRKRRRVPAL